MAIHNKLVQGSTEFAFESCNDQGYIQRMTETFKKGMVLTFSLWGEDWNTMSWLDSMTGCQGGCNKDTAEVTFSDIKIEKKTML